MRAEPRLLRLDRDLARASGVLHGLAHVAEGERRQRDHRVRVDELVAVLQRSRDGQPSLVREIRLAEVAELAIGVAHRVEAQRALAQEAELLRDGERLFRGRERRLPVGVRRLGAAPRHERLRGEEQHALARARGPHDGEASFDEPFEIRVLRVPARAELRHVRKERRDRRRVGVALFEEHERALVRRQGAIVLTAVAPYARDQVERLHGLLDPSQLLEDLECLVREAQRLDVRMDRGRALGRLP